MFFLSDYIANTIFKEGITINQNYISKRIKEKRENLQFTQQTVADYIGISRAAYCEYEQGRKLPTLNNFIKLSKCFNCTPNDLLIDYFDNYSERNSSAESLKTILRILSNMQNSSIDELIKFIKENNY